MGFLHTSVCASLLQPLSCTAYSPGTPGPSRACGSPGAGGRMVCSASEKQCRGRLRPAVLLHHPPPHPPTPRLLHSAAEDGRTSHLAQLPGSCLCPLPLRWGRRGAQAATDTPALVTCSVSPRGGPGWKKALPACVSHLDTETLSMGMLLTGP